VFDQEIHVQYGQFYVERRTDDFFEGLTGSRGGQANGLCGAAVPGLLSGPPRRRWGGRLPDEQVRRTNGALALAQLDRDLVDGIADLDPATRRAVAVWAARRACAAVKMEIQDYSKCRS
jgi:hypothetical protein